jgi:hypothetical protein
VPDWLYFRRHHGGSIEGTARTIRQKAVAWDPRRADRLRHPTARLIAEYVWAYIAAIARVPMSWADRAACYRHLATWTLKRAIGRTVKGRPGRPWPSVVPATQSNAEKNDNVRVGAIADIVAGRERSAS